MRYYLRRNTKTGILELFKDTIQQWCPFRNRIVGSTNIGTSVIFNSACGTDCPHFSVHERVPVELKAFVTIQCGSETHGHECEIVHKFVPSEWQDDEIHEPVCKICKNRFHDNPIHNVGDENGKTQLVS